MGTKKRAKPEKHPWRICPLGMHWRGPCKVHAHYRKGRKVKEYYRSGCCARNKSRYDQIYEAELEKMALERFSLLDGAPSSDDLGYERGNEFDALIRGWTRYWNEILSVSPPLDGNFVKALIATESSFDPSALTKSKDPRRQAFGLMQVTGEAREILQKEGGELKDHLVNISEQKLKDPTLNIAAGIRVLFHKFERARAQDSKATWVDAACLYKGYKRNHPQIKKLLRLYERLLKTNKSIKNKGAK